MRKIKSDVCESARWSLNVCYDYCKQHRAFCLLYYSTHNISKACISLWRYTAITQYTSNIAAYTVVCRITSTHVQRVVEIAHNKIIRIGLSEDAYFQHCFLAHSLTTNARDLICLSIKQHFAWLICKCTKNLLQVNPSMMWILS